MKVAFFEVFSSYGEFIGGDAKEVYYFCECLRGLGYQAQVINFNFKEKLFLRDMRLALKLLKVKKSDIDADIVFASGTPFWAHALNLLSARIGARQILYITHLNDFFIRFQRAYDLSTKSFTALGKKKFLEGFLINAGFIFLNLPDLFKRHYFISASLRKIDKVLVSSDFLGREIKRIYGPGIDYEIMYPMVKNYNLTPPSPDMGDPLIFYFGECSISRGVVDLVEALVLVKERFKNIKLLISKHPQSESMTFKILAALIKKYRLEHNVEFFGYQDNINLLLERATIVCLPHHNASVFQPPLTLLEAMALEKPVVSTAVGSIPEFIIDNKTGVIVPPRDSSKLAEKLNSLLADQGLRRILGRGARSIIEQKCSPEIVTEKLSIILEGARQL